MSKYTKTEIECPECGNKQEFMTFQNIIGDIDIEIKEKVLNGELFVFTCEKCGKRFPITYPCLYHDMTKKLMVYLSQDENSIEEMNGILLGNSELYENQMSQGYVHRAVKTVNELAEKIMIHDMKLDDRIIEIIKMLIMFKSMNEGLDVDTIAGMFYYPGKDGSHEILIMFNDGRQSRIPIDEELMKETMDNLGEKIAEHQEVGYQQINIEWVSKVLQ